MDYMKITSPVGLNLVVDGTVPKVKCFSYSVTTQAEAIQKNCETSFKTTKDYQHIAQFRI